MRCLMTVIGVLYVLLSPAAAMDDQLYAEVLRRHVKDGLVDYVGLKAHRENLDTYLDRMGDVNPEGLSYNEQLAFYINLYNASTLKLIIDHYPVKSIKDIGSFFSSPWKLEVVKLHGEMVTLDHVEHEIVRPRFKDARVHFALNCSALSCPPLLEVPYEADMVDDQLERATVAFINDGRNNYLDGETLHVSKIFSWFSEDFPEDFVTWFKGYSRGELKASLDQMALIRRKPRVRFLKYDWALNRQEQ